MRNLSATSRRHLAERAIERARADEEAGVQHRAVDLAFEDAGAVKVEQAFDEHLGAAVEAGLERRDVRRRRADAASGRRRSSRLRKSDGVAVAQDQRLARRRRRASRCRSARCRRPARCWRRAGRRRSRPARSARAAARTAENPVAGLSSSRSNSSAAMAASPPMNGSSELISPQNRKSRGPARRSASRSTREVGVAAQAERMRAVGRRDARPVARRR